MEARPTLSMMNMRRPGPGQYDVGLPIGDGGQPFGIAKRTLTTDAAHSRVYSDQIVKEQAFNARNVGFGDSLDDLMGGPPPLYHDAHMGSPELRRPVAPTREPPSSHAEHLNQLGTMPKLLNANIFPWAARSPFGGTRSVEAQMYMRTWREEHAPVNRRHYHRPNEFSELISGAARMGLNLYASDSKGASPRRA